MSKSKNFKQRWLPLALVPLFSVSVLAGCSSDDDDSGDDVMEEEAGVVGDGDGNGIPDAFETLSADEDTNGNGIIDIYETAADGTFTDSNSNAIDDSYEAAVTGGDDANQDGIDDAADPNAEEDEEETDPGGSGSDEIVQTGDLNIPLNDAGTAALNWDGSNLSGQVNIEGLADGVSATGAALFTGIEASGNGVQAIVLNGSAPTFFMPQPLSADQQSLVAENIVSGNMYAQVELSDGSSRNGPILLNGVEPRYIALSSANSVPAGDTASDGGAYFNINTVTGAFATVVNVNLQANDVDADGNPEIITAAHIHMGASDENGDVMVTLEDTGSGTSWSAQGTLSDDQLAEVLSGNAYFNVHRSDGSGFMRGQIPAF